MSDQQKSTNTASDQQMLVAHNLRASHKIITKLEESKSITEDALYRLPDAYFITNAKGTIFKANESAGKLLNVHIDDILFLEIKKLFSKESWNIFSHHINELIGRQANTDDKAQKKTDISFELATDGEGQKRRQYHWSLRIFDRISNRRGYLISIFGRDITDIREYERQLSQIFGTIPLGIVTVDKSGKVIGPYSAYCEYLFSMDTLRDVNFFDTFLEPAKAQMSKSEQLGILELREIFGQEAIWFDLSKKRFPQEIYYPLKNEGHRWLGLTYHPILVDDLIENMLVVIDNRTDVVQARVSQEAEKSQEKIVMERFLNIQRCDHILLEEAMVDLESLFQRLVLTLKNNDLRQYCNLLHGVKGVARTAGFKHLKDLVHSSEATILERLESKVESSIDFLQAEHQRVSIEWQELKKIRRLIAGDDENNSAFNPSQMEEILKDVRTLTSHMESSDIDDLQTRLRGVEQKIFQMVSSPVSSVEKKLSGRVKATAKELGKEVKLECQWAELELENSRLVRLEEILMHLTNNAIDHGIEYPDKRRESGKNEAGVISIEVKENPHDKTIEFNFHDDGHGVDIDQVKKRALEKHVCSENEIAELSDIEIMQYIFCPGFSTKNEVSEISGRGIGLDSVAASVLELGGNEIRVDKSYLGGAHIRFALPR